MRPGFAVSVSGRNFLRDIGKRFWRAKISRPLRTSEISHHHTQHAPLEYHNTRLNSAMSLPRIMPPLTRAIGRPRVCLTCPSSQFTRAIQHNGIAKLASYSHQPRTGVQFHSRSYATKQRLDGPRARADVDERSRLGFYTLTKQQGFLNMEPRTAQSIYQDFVANKSKIDHGDNVLRLVESVF